MRFFHAQAVAAEEIEEYRTFTVPLAEDYEGKGASLLIAISLDAPTDQDRELGQDTYSVSTESEATHYGGITRWVIKDRVLELELDAGAASTLEVDRFRIGIPEDSVAAVTEGLRRLLGEAEALTGES